MTSRAIPIDQQRAMAWALRGLFYGYPRCCIEAFVSNEFTQHHPTWKDRVEEMPLNGTGFIPCLSCSTSKTAEQLTMEINAQRVASTSFPEPKEDDGLAVDDTAEFEAFYKQLLKRAAA